MERTAGNRMVEDQLELRSLTAVAVESVAESRSALAADVRDLFAGRSTRMSDREGSIVLALLEQLLRQVEGSLRSELAERLSRIEGIPAAVSSLVREQDADLSIQLLTAGALAGQAELIEAIRHRAMQHQLSVRMRRSLEVRVAAVLGEDTEPDVPHTLLDGGQADLTAALGRHLEEEAGRTDEYGEPRLRLEELEPLLASTLYWWVAAAVRHALLDRFDLDPALLDDAIEAAVGRLAPLRPVTEPTGFAVSSGTGHLVEHLARTSRISSDLLLRSLRQGRVALFELLLGRLMNLAMLRLRRVLLDPSARSFAIACRAIDLDRQSFTTLYLLRYQGGDRSVQDPGELSRVLRFYDSIRPEDARQVLRQWRRHPTYLGAIEAIGTR